jgi:hypothetical protein
MTTLNDNQVISGCLPSLSSEVVVRGYHQRLLAVVAISDFNQGLSLRGGGGSSVLSSGVFVMYCHPVLSSGLSYEDIIWGFHVEMSSGVVI